MSFRIRRVLLTLAAVVGLVSTGQTLGAPAASAAGSPLTIAYVTSLTGLGASTGAGSQAGFLARIALQNARGGVNGHRLVPLVIDDQSNPATVVTAVQGAISKGVIGIVSQTAIFFAAAKYAQQAGIPVTGFYGDGPEWGTPPNTNMFASDHGSVNPKYPATTLLGNFLRAHGGTIIGSYGYGISPQSAAAARGNALSFKFAGGKIGVLDTTVPFGGVDFTSAALVAKQNHVNALSPSLETSSNFALAVALQQAGVKLKAALYATGYDPAVINSPVWPALRGAYFLSPFRPWSLPNAGTIQMQATMRRYAHFTKNQFPTFGQYEAWSGANLMILGIQRAGANPTSASVITALRGVKAYNANGLLPITINYSTIFGKDPLNCTWIMQAQKTGFVAVSSRPFCGGDIKGTSTISG